MVKNLISCQILASLAQIFARLAQIWAHQVFCEFFFYYLLDIVPSYHSMIFKCKLANHT